MPEIDETREPFQNALDGAKGERITQRIVVNGCTYMRSGGGFLHEMARHETEIKTMHWYAERRPAFLGPPEVLCVCLNDQFTIHFGDYKCLAKCTKCGAVHAVYEG